MKTTKEYIDLISTHANELRSQFGISSLCLFGSVSRGEQTEGSDVDVCVMLKSTFYYRLPNGRKPEEYGIVPATMTFPLFRGYVKDALVSMFGKGRCMSVCDVSLEPECGDTVTKVGKNIGGRQYAAV